MHTHAIVHRSRDQIDESTGRVSPSRDDRQRRSGVNTVCVEQVLIHGDVNSRLGEAEQHYGAVIRPGRDACVIRPAEPEEADGKRGSREQRMPESIFRVWQILAR